MQASTNSFNPEVTHLTMLMPPATRLPVIPGAVLRVGSRCFIRHGRYHYDTENNDNYFLRNAEDYNLYDDELRVVN